MLLFQPAAARTQTSEFALIHSQQTAESLLLLRELRSARGLISLTRARPELTRFSFLGAGLSRSLPFA
jgi:hypothetical protein